MGSVSLPKFANLVSNADVLSMHGTIEQKYAMVVKAFSSPELEFPDIAQQRSAESFSNLAQRLLPGRIYLLEIQPFQQCLFKTVPAFLGCVERERLFGIRVLMAF